MKSLAENMAKEQSLIRNSMGYEFQSIKPQLTYLLNRRHLTALHLKEVAHHSEAGQQIIEILKHINTDIMRLLTLDLNNY